MIAVSIIYFGSFKFSNTCKWVYRKSSKFVINGLTLINALGHLKQLIAYINTKHTNHSLRQFGEILKLRYKSIRSRHTTADTVTTKMRTVHATTIVTTHAGANYATTDLRTQKNTAVTDKTTMDESDQKETTKFEAATQFAKGIVTYAEFVS